MQQRSGLKIALAFNVKKSKPSKDISKQVDLEFDSIAVIEGIKSALEKLGHSVVLVEADEEAFLKLGQLKGRVDIVFNIAEGLGGDARESQIPMFCEILNIPYTHSSPTVHAITLNKAFAKLILKGAGGILVPESKTVRSKDDILGLSLTFPVIVKPNKEGSSKGILDKSVVRKRTDLVKIAKEISENWTKEILVEEFIDGREFTVAVIGNQNPQILPIVEQKFGFLPKGMNNIASFELKWLYEDAIKDLSQAYDCPAKLSVKKRRLIEKASKRIYQVLEVRDCARVDYRLRGDDLYFIEINTLPGMNPDEKIISYLPLAARMAGMSFDQLVQVILESALKRYNLKR